MKSSIAFRHRVGRMDWKMVSSMDVDDIIEHGDISELQSALDSITFCEFKSSDVRNNSIDSVAKLVQVMQLIIEYLLHCQENQYKLVEALHKKNSKVKSSLKNSINENNTLKEDVKIYQRQLTIMRHSLTKAQDMLRDVIGGNFDGKTISSDAKELNKINVEYIQNLLEQHRVGYMRDVENLIGTSLQGIMKSLQENTRSAETSNTSKLDNNILLEFQKSLELTVQSAIQAVERTSRIAFESRSENLSRADESAEALKLAWEDLQKQSALLDSREAVVKTREDAIAARVQEFESMKLVWEEERRRELDELSREKSQVRLMSQGAEIPDTVVEVIDDDSLPRSESAVVMVSTATSMTQETLQQQRQRFVIGYKIILSLLSKSESSTSVAVS